MEILGLSILAIVAVILFIAGLGVFKVNPLVGAVLGIGAFLVLLGAMLSAFGGVGFINNLLSNVWIQYLTVGGASYAIGTVAGALW